LYITLHIRKTVGIFSLLGKKEPPARKQSERTSTAKNQERSPARSSKNAEAGQEQRKAARATAMKIDAIESEMSSEFVKPLPFSGNTMPGPASQFLNTMPHVPETAKPDASNAHPATADAKHSTMLPTMGESTAFLLGVETVIGPVAISTSEAAPVIEEAAILFANGQTELIEPILLHAIEEDALGSTPLTVWGMLFDLYQVTGQQASFENLSIRYANKFEMSPPTWITQGAAQEKPAAVAAPRGNSVPGVSFAGKLDSSCIKQLERIKNMAENSNVLRLEFVRVTEIDPIGCGLLLSVMKKLQKSGHKLILVGAAELIEKIRAILQVGRRDETEAPWLLMLEFLRLLNREADFEETSLDYCVTFEVSPPAFESPKDKVVTDTEESLAPEEDSADHFMMPAVIEMPTGTLLQNITAHAHAHNPVVLDCSNLQRMDFNAAGQLFGGLTPLLSGGKSVELLHPNHFIIALCEVMGFKDALRIIPRKS
jgi:anti-anti-sigma regulatory factor